MYKQHVMGSHLPINKDLTKANAQTVLTALLDTPEYIDNTYF